MTEPTRPVPVHDVRPGGPEPFTRGWQGPQAPGHPGGQVVVRPVAAPPYPPYQGYPPARELSSAAVVAFVFGCLGVMGMSVLSFAGLVLSYTSWKETSSGRKDGHGLQIAGLVLNIVGAVIAVGVVLFVLAYVGLLVGVLGVAAVGSS